MDCWLDAGGWGRDRIVSVYGLKMWLAREIFGEHGEAPACASGSEVCGAHAEFGPSLAIPFAQNKHSHRSSDTATGESLYRAGYLLLLGMCGRESTRTVAEIVGVENIYGNACTCVRSRCFGAGEPGVRQ